MQFGQPKIKWPKIEWWSDGGLKLVGGLKFGDRKLGGGLKLGCQKFGGGRKFGVTKNLVVADTDTDT